MEEADIYIYIRMIWHDPPFRIPTEWTPEIKWQNLYLKVAVCVVQMMFPQEV